MADRQVRRRGEAWVRPRWALLVLALLLPLLAAPPTAGAAPARAAAGPARVVKEVRVGDRMLDLAVSSPSTGAPVKWVRLLLPRHWSKRADRTWPVLWLLHGGGGNHKDWTDNTHIEELTAGRDVIVVMPETSACSGYSDWWNYGKGGAPAWETYLLDEVRPLLENGYRAGTARAIAGLSMGGQGALKLTATRPGMFRAAASYSGAVNPLFKSPDGGFDGPDAVKAGGIVCLTDWKRLWGEPGYPFDTDDPADLRQQRLWQRNSPLHRASALAGTPLYLSYGDGTHSGTGWKWGDPPPSAARCVDPPKHGTEAIERVIHGMNQQLRARLAELRIPAMVCAHKGVHTWPYWERELVASFPMLMRSLGIPGPSGG
ncbi:alpha/beta hydrolase family protein [Streptomyces sp. NPDC046261]|uniref:alpha/beta hydrolase n=1 Tax=Streptomyces sp. NPDC046261 TaxID=3157200 RepID=UPI0033DDBE68